MIPYFYYPTISLGFVYISAWGLFAALGFGLAIYIAWKHARCRAQNPDVILDLSFWLILAAIIGARFAHVFFYDWGFYRENPAEILKIWHGGLSLFGGFFGASLAGFLYFRKHKLNFLEHADILIYTLPAGLFVGRIGCFLVHDHPGTLTNFILAVKYPDGARHDLGLYLGIFDIILFAIFLIIEKTRLGKFLFKGQSFSGFYVIFFLITYSIARFFLDFLRAYDLSGSDARYGGLTPAQYGSMALFGLGLWLFFRLRSNLVDNRIANDANTTNNE